MSPLKPFVHCLAVVFKSCANMSISQILGFQPWLGSSPARQGSVISVLISSSPLLSPLPSGASLSLSPASPFPRFWVPTGDLPSLETQPLPLRLHLIWKGGCSNPCGFLRAFLTYTINPMFPSVLQETRQVLLIDFLSFFLLNVCHVKS